MTTLGAPTDSKPPLCQHLAHYFLLRLLLARLAKDAVVILTTSGAGASPLRLKAFREILKNPGLRRQRGYKELGAPQSYPIQRAPLRSCAGFVLVLVASKNELRTRKGYTPQESLPRDE